MFTINIIMALLVMHYCSYNKVAIGNAQKDTSGLIMNLLQ